MEIFGIAITILSGVIAYLAWNNGKWMKETLNRQMEISNKQTEMLIEIKNVIVEEAKSTREIILKMDENLRETLKKMEENTEIRHREVVQILTGRKV